MPRENTALEFNSFVRGLITEASPLTFPENASKEETNFVLKRDGSRRRRLGMDYEDSAVQVSFTGASQRSDGELCVTAYKWNNSERGSLQQVAVVQADREIKFFDMSSTPLSSGLLYTHTIATSESAEVKYATVDGLLVIVYGSRFIEVFTNDSGTISLSRTGTLKIRDFFGVEDLDPQNGSNYRDSNNSGIRPDLTTDAHLYNLRNQGWGVPRRDGNEEELKDPIRIFFEQTVGYTPERRIGGRPTVTTADSSEPYLKFPSNADFVGSALYADNSDSDDRVGERFFAKDLRTNSDRVGEAPRGHFIIDALQRGTSRLQSLEDMYDKYAGEADQEIFLDDYKVGSLNIDEASSGATCIESFAGRVFFAGFGATSNDGDSHSPRMSSFVLFSRLVDSEIDIFKCYQDADPTSTIDSDLVDTDGGFIKIAGADVILDMKVIGRSLIVFASNGVWSVDGGDDLGFKATNFRVTKLSESGTDSPNASVVAENSAFYWSADGIYAITPDQFGALQVQSISATTIQTFYQDIPHEERLFCKGIYDNFDRKVRWLYNNRPNSVGNAKELAFDLDLNAFSTSDIARPAGYQLYPAAMVEVPPFVVGEINEDVTVGGEVVTADAVDVYVELSQSRDQVREVAYVTVTDIDPTVTITFSSYRDSDFLDWVSLDAVGTDALATMLTGHTTGGDSQRYKQVPYLTAHFYRTEDGFELDGSGNPVPTNQSGCLMSAQWDWANSANSGRWSTPRQVYRYKRHYFPNDVADPYDYGFETIVTKNKLRGKGRAVSLKFESEPGKDCQLVGWSMIMGVNGNV